MDLQSDQIARRNEFVNAVNRFSQEGIDDYEDVDVALTGRSGIPINPTRAAVYGTGLKAGGGYGLSASSSGVGISLGSGSGLGRSGSDADSTSLLGLGGRFLGGAFYGAVNMVWQPVAQTLDLGQAGVGLLTGGKYEPTWLSGISRNYAAGMSYGETVTRAVLGSNPVTGIGMASYDLTTSAMHSDWGGVAEGLGGMVGSYGLVKGGQRYFAPEPGAQLGVYRVRPEIEVTDPLVSPGNLLKPLPADQAPNFISAQPVFLGGKTLYRIFDDVKAFASGRWWADKSASASEGSWRSGYAVTEEWNAGTMQASYTPSGLWGWGGKAAPQAIKGFSDKFNLFGSEFRYGWIQPGGKYQIFINDARSVITGPGLKTGKAPW